MIKPIWVIFSDIDRVGVCDVFFCAYRTKDDAVKMVKRLKESSRRWHYKIVKYVPEGKCA